MCKYSWLTILMIITVLKTVSAQQSAIYTHDLVDFNKAVLLYNEKQYLSAQILFTQVKGENKNQEVQSDCDYYIANVAIRLGQPNAEQLMENFLQNYPTNTKQNQAFLEVANYYFEQGKYPFALKWFDKVNESSISEVDRDKYNFQLGYSYFSANKVKEAQDYFNKVINSAEYGSQVKYYLGFIAYEEDDYKEANEYFDQVSGEEKYKEKMSYYQADMNFKLSNFQKAIDLGVKQMAKSDANEKSELSKIIGESYFNLKQYDKAIPYLVNYNGKKGKWNNTDFYLLGYAYYKQNDFENAIAQFNKIIDGKDFVAQNAYYHLGESYLKTDKKQQALNAFKNASEMDFDPKIQEDASLNYVKLSYEIGNSYQSVPQILSAYLSKYPNSASKKEVETLLISSYVTSKNYKEALVLLEKNKSSENKKVYQKVTFYRGLEFYMDGNYQEALEMFKKSLTEPRDDKFTARAIFWRGETEYVLSNFTSALISFKQFTVAAEIVNITETKNSNYNLAYTYFKLKEYEQAAIYFQAYITHTKNDKVRLNDAYLRLGDSYFVSTKYWLAMEAYNKAIEMKGVDADYAFFQKAISYGLVDRNEKKIEDLNKFIQNYPKSQLRDDALFELGNTYVTEKKTDNALKVYNQLIAEYKESSYLSKAILKQGLVYYNTENDQQALAKFKKVVAEYPNTPEALEAVSIGRLIYVDQGKVDEYTTWVKNLDFIEVSDADFDNTTFESAEKQYLQNNTKQAITNFTDYLTKFPNGINALKANFYLAQSYFADGLENNAVPNYEYVIAKPRNEFTEQALARLAQINLKKNDYNKAVPILKRLEIEADYPQNITFSQSNLMRAYYDQEEYANAVLYADKVVSNLKTDDKVKSDAQIIVARSAMKVGDEVKGKVAYAKLQTIAKGELAAEALYYDAYFKNKEGKFEASNTVIQKLAKDYSGYKYFGARGLLLMAKNFYQLKDSFQANFILESVISNFGEYTDIVEEAQKELTVIKAEEAKSNSSIRE